MSIYKHCFWALGILFFCGLTLADEVADFAAAVDAEEKEEEKACGEEGAKDEAGVARAVKECVENGVVELEAMKDEPWQRKLESLVPRESGCSAYAVLKAYQQKHAVPDKEIRDGFHAILLNSDWLKKEPPFSKCDGSCFMFYANVLQHYGDETTLQILEQIIDRVPEGASNACRAHIAIARGEPRGRLWRYFVEDDGDEWKMRRDMIHQVAACAADDEWEKEDQERFRIALLRLYYLCEGDFEAGRALIALRCLNSRFLSSFKYELIMRAKLSDDRRAIIELKRPRWQKITLAPKLEKWFQEILQCEVPPRRSPNSFPAGWKGK